MALHESMGVSSLATLPFGQKFINANNKNNQSFEYWIFVRAIHWWPMESPDDWWIPLTNAQ